MKSADSRAAEVPQSLQLAWVRHLRWFYDLFNEQYVGGRLRPPIIKLGHSEERLGEWDQGRRALTIGIHHILTHRWEAVLDTLRHEMAHQYVHEVMQLPDARPHGPEFARACTMLCCDAACRASQDRLDLAHDSDSERDRIMLRVRELMALADSPNEHEAASAMRMAHRFLLKYNLSLSDLSDLPQYAVRYLGSSAARIQEYQYTLGHILQEHFFVLVIWTYSYDPSCDRLGRVLQVSGRPENIEVADYVYHYVVDLCDALWKEQRRRPRAERGTKLQYLAGVLDGLAEKLDRQRRQLKEEQGLVWCGDAKLRKFARRLSPRVSSVSGGGVSRGAGYYEGVVDGRKITIRRPIGGDRRDRGLALPGSR